MLDTDVVIAALDRSDAHHRDASAVLQALIHENVDLMISMINYAEVLVRPAESEENLRKAVDAIAALGIKPIAPTVSIARDAARFRSQSISLADGFALATARARSATAASFDRRVRPAMSNLGIAAPRALETARPESNAGRATD